MGDWVLGNYQVPLPGTERWSSANLSRAKARHMMAESDVQVPRS